MTSQPIRTHNFLCMIVLLATLWIALAASRGSAQSSAELEPANPQPWSVSLETSLRPIVTYTSVQSPSLEHRGGKIGVMELAPSLRVIAPNGLGFLAGLSLGIGEGQAVLGRLGFAGRVSLIDGPRTHLSIEGALGMELGEAQLEEISHSFNIFPGGGGGGYYDRGPTGLLVGGFAQAQLFFERGLFRMGIGLHGRAYTVGGSSNLGIDWGPLVTMGLRFEP